MAQEQVQKQAGKSSAADGVAKQLTQMSPGPGGMIGARLGFRPLSWLLTETPIVARKRLAKSRLSSIRRVALTL